MATGLFTHKAGLAHETPPGHPEQIARLKAVQEALADPAFDALIRIEAPRAADEDVLLAHPAAYLAALKEAAPETGLVHIDGDTVLSPGTLEAAYRGLGGCVEAVKQVMAGELRNAFVAMRPPGHHAERNRAMGFCLFSNIAIAAKAALRDGANRVAVVDFDVHHGNGTQDVLWDEERALFISSHQMPLYPGTGRADEVGAHGNIFNVPLTPNSDGAVMRALYEQQIFPRLSEFSPDLILVSAGFDAHAADPLANLNWQEEDFAWLGRNLQAQADDLCEGRLVSTLEGGYDLDALAGSVGQFIRAIMP